jgi:hypothetical protein
VLGCTHYPLVATQIEKEFLRLREERDAAGAQPNLALVGPKLTLVNPALFTAKELFRELFQRKLRLPAGEKSLAERDAFYVTVGREGPLSDERKYGREPGRFDVVEFRAVPMTGDGASRAAVEVWRKLLPAVAERLGP